MVGEAECEHVVAIRVVATPLLRVARSRQVHLVAKKLPEKQVQHFVEQRGRTVERVGGPERRAQDNGITREWNEGSWRSARDHECSEEAAIIGGRGAPEVRHACAKRPGHRPKALGDQVCGLPVVCPWPRRIPKKVRNRRTALLSRAESLSAALSASQIASRIARRIMARHALTACGPHPVPPVSHSGKRKAETVASAKPRSCPTFRYDMVVLLVEPPGTSTVVSLLNC